MRVNYGAPIKRFYAICVRWGYKFRVDGDQLYVTVPEGFGAAHILNGEIRKRSPQLIALLKGEYDDKPRQSELLADENTEEQ